MDGLHAATQRNRTETLRRVLRVGSWDGSHAATQRNRAETLRRVLRIVGGGTTKNGTIYGAA